MDSTTNLNEAVDNPRSRRALLAGVVGGLGAWLVSAAQRAMPADAANGDPVILGALNIGNDTRIEGANESETALFLDSFNVGLDSSGGINGVIGRSPSSIGVAGISTGGVGVYGASQGGYAGEFDGRVLVRSFIDLEERSTPAKPFHNRARLFVRENGANHTQLCVRFPNGNTRVLATA